MIVNILSAMLDQVSSSCNRPFGVRAPRDNMETLWSILYKFHKDSVPNLLKLAAVPDFAHSYCRL